MLVSQSEIYVNSLLVLINPLGNAIYPRITPPVNPLIKLSALEKAYEKKIDCQHVLIQFNF